MGKHFSKKGQRFRRGRQGQMVTPGVSGLLISVDPGNAQRAARELQLLLEPLKDALLAEEEGSDVDLSSDGESHSDGGTNDEESPGQHDQGTTKAGALTATASSSVSAMLEMELAAMAANHGSRSSNGVHTKEAVISAEDLFAKKRGRDEDGYDNGQRRAPNSEPNDKPKRPRKDMRKEWLAVLETNCKGYIFLNVPFPNSLLRRRVEVDEEPDCPDETETTAAGLSDGNAAKQNVEGDPVEKLSSQYQYCSRHPNTRILPLLDRLFERLGQSATLPPCRHSYRCYPVQLVCFPTIACITAAVRAVTQDLPVPPGRSANRIAVLLQIKNNTNVETEKHRIRRAIEECLPMSRFLVLSIVKGVEVDVALSVFIAHSLCLVGLMPQYHSSFNRRQYNLHEFVKDALQLSDMITKE